VTCVRSAQPPGPSSHPAAATLEFREATKVYPGQSAAAVDGLSLEVPAGEICVLVGPSGCGKTTAMRMVNRMIDITSGDILLDGRSVKERPPAELRRQIGREVLERVQEPLTVEAMQELNSRVDLDKEEPSKVASEYLKEEGFVQ
jgi:ABC-type proline/glycine betaine transport system ATPase subunit